MLALFSVTFYFYFLKQNWFLRGRQSSFALLWGAGGGAARWIVPLASSRVVLPPSLGQFVPCSRGTAVTLEGAKQGFNLLSLEQPMP